MRTALPDKRRLPLGAKPFNSNEDDRGPRGLGEREMPVKIVVERDTNPVFLSRNP
jgi:hypothetical protein